MQLHKDSHLDHALTQEHIDFLLTTFADRNAFFIATVDLPDHLAALPCSLMGPLVGDEPVPESEVKYVTRGERTWQSRTIECAYPRTSRKVTVIAGPHDGEACVLFTAYGGPLAPQEPGDPGCKDKVASSEFWSQHALIEVVL